MGGVGVDVDDHKSGSRKGGGGWVLVGSKRR